MSFVLIYVKCRVRLFPITIFLQATSFFEYKNSSTSLDEAGFMLINKFAFEKISDVEGGGAGVHTDINRDGAKSTTSTLDNPGVKLVASRLHELTDFNMVNLNFYPACPNPDLTVGVGRHSDGGMLTVLLQDGIGGLYVKKGEHASPGDEVWVEIPPMHGALVINVGDALQILSNGRYKSVEHRVRTTDIESRVSVPIFNAPLPATKIGPFPEVVAQDGVARYKEVVYEEYLKNYFGKFLDGKKSLDFASLD